MIEVALFGAGRIGKIHAANLAAQPGVQFKYVVDVNSLDHLAGSGDERVQLYVEADQERVVRMYDRAGFTVGQVDTSYRRKG